jgi:hypothetical protein
MNRRKFLKHATATVLFLPSIGQLAAAEAPQRPATFRIDPELAEDWLARWEKRILGGSRERYCDHEMGEELGWLMSPFLNGFYYGYKATGDVQWVERLVDWTEAWVKRGIKEPDGFVGWPKAGTGGIIETSFYTDSLLGEAMALRPVVVMAAEIQKNAALQKQFGSQANGYVALAEKTFEKWVARGSWREVKDGGVWVVPEFGIDKETGKWTTGYTRRHEEGFSNPDNKQNHIARWLVAMHDVTGKPVYREHAQKWWRVMKSRMHTRENGKYLVWNYWEPAGPWDFKPDGSTKHWVGVHPNGGYYQIDLEGIVTAFEHDLVFTRDDLNRLIATNRDFMWNQRVAGAEFRRIDGGESDPRWKEAPGVLWTALVPYDDTLRRIFLANHDPASWGGLIVTPWFLSLGSP